MTSVGYRVKSKRGIQFRIWANSVLKQYLLNAYAINAERIMAYQSNILQLEAKTSLSSSDNFLFTTLFASMMCRK